jgi:hypothetical protein
MKLVMNEHTVVLDGEDVSGRVVSITLEMEDGTFIKRRPPAVVAQELGLMLEAVTKLATYPGELGGSQPGFMVGWPGDRGGGTCEPTTS